MTRMAAPAGVADQAASGVYILRKFAKFLGENPQLNPDECAESFHVAYPFQSTFDSGHQLERSSPLQINKNSTAPPSFKPESCPQSGTSPLVGSHRMARGNSTQTGAVSLQQAFAMRSGRSPQQFQYTNPVSLSSSFPRRESILHNSSKAPSSHTLQSLGIDSASAPALQDYLGQNNRGDPFHGLNVDTPSGFGGARMAKGYPILKIDPMLDGFSAPQMSHQPSSSTSGYLTGGEDGYFDSPHSLSFPMGRHSRSFSHGSFNSSCFSSSQPESVSPTDRLGFPPESYSMSRQASSASYIPGGLPMMRVQSSTGSSVADGMGSVHGTTSQSDFDDLLNGVGGFASENGDISSLNKASAQVVLKRSSSVSVEDLNDSMVKGGQLYSLPSDPLNPRKQRRIKGETDSQPQQSTNTVKQEKTNKTEISAKADKTSTTRHPEKKGNGGNRHLPTIKPGKNPNNTSVSTSKPSYIRPPHPRVYCDKCTTQPEGFRGDHELRRHTDRQHAPTRKMYVIKDISDGKTLLAKCKACQSGKKYGVDYNAAAHLRRQHFKTKVRNGKNKSKVPTIDQATPDMAELRGWMEEVEVYANNGSDDDPNSKGDTNGNEDDARTHHERESGSDNSEEGSEEQIQQQQTMDEGEGGREALQQEVAEQNIQQQQQQSASEIFQEIDMGMEMDIEMDMGVEMGPGNLSQIGSSSWPHNGWSDSAVNGATSYTLSNTLMPEQLTHEFGYRVSTTTGSIPLPGEAFNHQQGFGIHLPTQRAHQLLLQESLHHLQPSYTSGSNITVYDNFLPAAARSAAMFDDSLTGSLSDLPDILPGNLGDNLKPY